MPAGPAKYRSQRGRDISRPVFFAGTSGPLTLAVPLALAGWFELVADGQAGAVGNGVHQVLEVGENMGVGFVTVFGHYVAVNDDVELAVWARGEFEG